MSTTIGTTLPGTIPDITGLGVQRHMIKDSAGRAWLFYLSSGSLTTLRTQVSGVNDLTTWAAGATFTLGKSVNSDPGIDFSVAYKAISGVDVVHITGAYNNANNEQTWHLRATISGTTITFGAEGDTSGHSAAYTGRLGTAVAIDSANNIWHASGWLLNSGSGDPQIAKSSNADAGTSWTAGFAAATDFDNAINQFVNDQAIIPLASGAVLYLWGDTDSGTWAVGTEVNNDINYCVSDGATNTPSPPATTGLFGSTSLGGMNDWGATGRGTATIDVVRRTGSNTYAHRVGTISGSPKSVSWGAGGSIPTQASVGTTGGLPMVSDGTNTWLFVIDSGAGNHVRYCKYNGSSWGAWTDLETSSATRSYLGAWYDAATSTIVVYWTQTNGSNFDVAVTSLGTAGGVADPFPLAYPVQPVWRSI